MDNKELARECVKTECRKCKPDVKAECLKNECWHAVYPKDNMPPCVYYGLIRQAPSEHPEEEEAWRKRWFEARGIPYQPPRPIKQLFPVLTGGK